MWLSEVVSGCGGKVRTSASLSASLFLDIAVELVDNKVWILCNTNPWTVSGEEVSFSEISNKVVHSSVQKGARLFNACTAASWIEGNLSWKDLVSLNHGARSSSVLREKRVPMLHIWWLLKFRCGRIYQRCLPLLRAQRGISKPQVSQLYRPNESSCSCPQHNLGKLTPFQNLKKVKATFQIKTNLWSTWPVPCIQCNSWSNFSSISFALDIHSWAYIVFLIQYLREASDEAMGSVMRMRVICMNELT